MSGITNPSHPGETLGEDVLPALNLTVEQAAENLGVPVAMLTDVLQCRAPITPGLAAKIEAWLGAENGGRAEVWLAQQAAYDQWQAMDHADRERICDVLDDVELAAIARERAGEKPVSVDIDDLDSPFAHLRGARFTIDEAAEYLESNADAVREAIRTGRLKSESTETVSVDELKAFKRSEHLGRR